MEPASVLLLRTAPLQNSLHPAKIRSAAATQFFKWDAAERAQAKEVRLAGISRCARV